MEERDSENDLVYERFDRLLDYGWVVVEHDLKVRSNDLQHQYVMFSVWAFHLEVIQECENAVGARVCYP